MNPPKNERRPVRGAVNNKVSDLSRPLSQNSKRDPDSTRKPIAVKRWTRDRRRELARLRARANGQALVVEALQPTQDVRLVVGSRGRHHAFVIVQADELEQVAAALAREVERRRASLRSSSASKECAFATGNRLRFLREREQRDGYVAAFRDDRIELRAREGRVEHRPSSISEEHAALLVEYRAELLAELEEIARTVAGAPVARAVGISSRGGIR